MRNGVRFITPEMHTHLTPVHRKNLADPAACGVRLGVELRAAAERAAYSSGMCLSHWIKMLVEQALSRVDLVRGRAGSRSADETKDDSIKKELHAAFAREMERLDDR